MNTIELLESYLEQERNNQFCYATNYRMDTPKKGYEREFQEAVENAENLEALIDRLKKEG